uniref:TatD DNase domain containing 3 n=1 Tax=Varanus komodoensis TaxID=61221 RepID=A0A8D2ITW8_VARKO
MGAVDCHCHLAAPEFHADIESVLEDTKKAKVLALVVVAEYLADFEKIIQLSKRYPGFVFPCLGIHPVQTSPAGLESSVTLKLRLQSCIHLPDGKSY